MSHWLILLSACVLDAAFGYPRWLYARIRHPVVWMGTGINLLERNFNRPYYAPSARRVLGLLAMALLVGLTLVVAVILQRLGWMVEVLCTAALLAQWSLYTHVHSVYAALAKGDIAAARNAVGQIVGRDVESLDAAGIARAAIESLAESFSDGVVAPVFWAACFGLPGIACYKMINTADSMIGHRDERYAAFGWAAARLDDVANLIPARISALLLVVASGGKGWRIVWGDARKHASPNAGWPEAAMAGVLGLALAGPQIYDGVEHAAAVIGDGTREATAAHIKDALRLYIIACGLLWLMLPVPLLVMR